MDDVMAAQENVALARSLLDLYNNRQSDPAWLDTSLAAFAADFEVIDVPSGTTLHGPDGLKRLLLFFVESSTHGALGQTAVLFCLAAQEGEDRQSPSLLRYDDPDGTTRSRPCNGTGDGVTSPARFSCSMRNAVGNSCRVHKQAHPQFK